MPRFRSAQLADHARHARRGLLAACVASLMLPVAAETPLEEIIVTATPLRTTAAQTAQPVQVIAGDAWLLERESSLGDSLANQPGVSASSFGPVASRPLLRGQGGLRVQMFQDGADVLDVAALSDDHAVTLEPLMTERIEIVRGPAALLFGNAAAAGAINVITRRLPRRSTTDAPVSAQLEARGDTASSERAVGAQLEGVLGTDWRWSGDLHRMTREDLKIPGGRLGSSGGDSQGGNLGLGWSSEDIEVAVAVSDFHSDYGLPASAGIRLDLQQRRVDLELTRRLDHALFSAWRWRFADNDYGHEEIEEDGEIGTAYAQRGRETRWSIDLGAPEQAWRGTLGVHGRELDFEAEGEEAFLPPSLTRQLGLFGFAARPVGPLALELGARYEHQQLTAASSESPAERRRYTDGAWTGSLGLRGPLQGRWSWSMQATSTARHPTATELFAAGPHLAVGRYEIGDEQLGTEIGRTLDLGLHLVDTPTGGRGSLRFFVADYRDFIAAKPTGLIDEDEGLPVVRFAATDARFSGAELEWAHDRLWQGDRAQIGVFLWGDAVRARDGAGKPLPQIPPHRLGAELTLVSGAWRAGLESVWHDAQRRLAPNETSTAGFTLIELSLAYRQRAGSADMLWYAQGSNLLDETARRHASPLKDVAPLAGRSLRLGVRLQF